MLQFSGIYQNFHRDLSGSFCFLYHLRSIFCVCLLLTDVCLVGFSSKGASFVEFFCDDSNDFKYTVMSACFVLTKLLHASKTNFRCHVKNIIIVFSFCKAT